LRTHTTASLPSVESRSQFSRHASVERVGELLFTSDELLPVDSEIRKLVARDLLGKRVFEWVKQSEALEQPLVVSKSFWQDLSWLLLAEGEEGALVDFLMIEAASRAQLHRNDIKEFYHNNESPTRYRLRRDHDLLSGLVAAKISLTLNGMPNDALRCLSTISGPADEKGTFHAMCWAGALTVLKRHLMNDRCAPYDEKLLLQFHSVMRTTTNSVSSKRELALLALWHPTSPDPYPALRLMETEMQVLLSWRNNRTATNFLEARC
jgi:hypothetical protein